jgi:hypothetical protein
VQARIWIAVGVGERHPVRRYPVHRELSQYLERRAAVLEVHHHRRPGFSMGGTHRSQDPVLERRDRPVSDSGFQQARTHISRRQVRHETGCQVLR